MDTDDYLAQCSAVLADANTYRVVKNLYPHDVIQKQVEHIMAPFKDLIRSINYTNFCYHPQTITKHQNSMAMRPIVAQSGSILEPSARFLDHVLKPLAESYDDYLKSSTSLILRLHTMNIPDNAILVTIDVESLYASIPPSECRSPNYCFVLNVQKTTSNSCRSQPNH